MILYIHTHTHPVPPPPSRFYHLLAARPEVADAPPPSTPCAHLVPATCIVRRRCAVRWPVLHARILLLLLLLLIFILLLLLLYIGTHLCTKTLWGLNVRLRFSGSGVVAADTRTVREEYIYIMYAARCTYYTYYNNDNLTIRFIYIL